MSNYNDLSSRALVIALTPEGMIQDLGGFRSGRQMETDIAPRSAILCRADALWAPLVENEKVQIAFEGNVIRAENLLRFNQRVRSAASRLQNFDPSIAHGQATQDQIHVLAHYDLNRKAFKEVVDGPGLSQWAGEPLEKITPPRAPSGSCDLDVVYPLINAIDGIFAQDPDGLCGWTLPNDQVLIRQAQGSRITVFDRDDPDLREILRGEPEEAEMIRRIYGAWKISDPGAPSPQGGAGGP